MLDNRPKHDSVRHRLQDLFGLIKGNVLWDTVKYAGWLVSCSLLILIRWLQNAPTFAIVAVLLGFWVGSLLLFFWFETRRCKRHKSEIILPASFNSPPKKWAAKMITAGGVFACIWGLTGICFSVCFKRPQVLPLITLQTMDGLPVGVPQNPHLRLNRLLVRNESDFTIDNFISRVQLPEPVFSSLETNHSPGTSVEWQPIIEPITLSGTGDRSILGAGSAVYYPIPHEGFFPAGAQGELFKTSNRLLNNSLFFPFLRFS